MSVAAHPPADTSTALQVDMSTSRWRRFAVVAFACFNAASLGIFFVVFVGVVVSPPAPRDAAFLLVAGSFAFAVLVMGQFVHWSRLALRAFKDARS